MFSEYNPTVFNFFQTHTKSSIYTKLFNCIVQYVRRRNGSCLLHQISLEIRQTQITSQNKKVFEIGSWYNQIWCQLTNITNETNRWMNQLTNWMKRFPQKLHTERNDKRKEVEVATSGWRRRAPEVNNGDGRKNSRKYPRQWWVMCNCRFPCLGGMSVKWHTTYMHEVMNSRFRFESEKLTHFIPEINVCIY